MSLFASGIQPCRPGCMVNPMFSHATSEMTYFIETEKNMSTNTQSSIPEISVIIPVMNEIDNIQPLSGELTSILDATPWSWECLWIDDESTDGTRQKLQLLHQQDSRHRYLFHSRNFGQSAAWATGFRHAVAPIFVTLDGDGQNDPAAIPELVRILKEKKVDMVNGWRQKRQDSIVRKISSRLANGFRNLLTGEREVRDVGCALRAFRRECVDNIPVFKGMHRFFPTLVRLAGHDKFLAIPVNHRPRERGKTKYGIHNRLWVGLGDTFAVCWMRRRLVFSQVAEMSAEQSDSSQT